MCVRFEVLERKIGETVGGGINKIFMGERMMNEGMNRDGNQLAGQVRFSDQMSWSIMRRPVIRSDLRTADHIAVRPVRAPTANF